MSSQQPRKTLQERVKEVEALPSIFDEIQKVLGEPALPPEHPDSAKQRRAKCDAQAALDDIEKRLPALVRRALEKMQEIIDRPQLPPDDPDATALQEAKRNALIQKLFWNAHYGPGGTLEKID